MQPDSSKQTSLSSGLSLLAATQLTATAYHESGHAVMALALGRLVQKVTVVPRKSHGNSLANPQGKSTVGGTQLGACQIKKGRSKASSNLLEDDVMILFAGMVAEARYTGQYCQQGAMQDLLNIKRLLCDRVSSQSQHDRIHRRLLDKTEHILSRNGHPQAIELIANELMQKATISGRAVRHFYEQTKQQDS
jgi:ATP-dependent Zn protease